MKADSKHTQSFFSSDNPSNIAIFTLIVAVVTLIAIGLVMVYSAASVESIYHGIDPSDILVQQLVTIIIGLALIVFVWKFATYDRLQSKFMLIAIGIISTGTLIALPFFGSEALGATRWIYFGSVSFQVSEFSKIIIVMFAARLLADFLDGVISRKSLLIQALLFVVLPILLILITQSDLGTTLICAIGIFAVLWFGEVPYKIIISLVAIVAASAVGAIAMSPYRLERINFMNPWADPHDTGYQLIHSFYAFAQGGLAGSGLGNSKEKFLYLPEAETDFIFAIIGEELGFICCLFIVICFLAILWAGLRISLDATKKSHKIAAAALTIMLVFQAFLNIGCVLGLLPTTGKPLPFLTQGGTSLLSCCFIVGLVLSIATYSSKENKYKENRKGFKLQSSPKK